MSPLRDVTIAARVPLSLRTDLEALRDEFAGRGELRADGGPLDLSVVIRRACAEYVDRNLRNARPGTLESLAGRPRSHRGGPITEQEAAEGAWPRANTQRRRALELVRDAGNEGRTGDELDELLAAGVYNGRRRLSELKAAGWVEVRRHLTVDGYVPIRRKTRAGHAAEVYVLTPAARIRLAEEDKQL